MQFAMPPRLPSPRSSLRRFQHLQVRTDASIGTSTRGSVIVQQIPAPGAGHIRVLLLNRPEARNALSRQLVDSLASHFDSIAAEQGDGPTRALIVSSNVDAAFCAGADLKERARFTKEE
jgi:methylglutaconyl-CoA hydratase